MKKTAWILSLFISLIWLVTADARASLSGVISLGMLPVQDESGAQVPAGLLGRIGQDFRQKLTLSYQDLLVRSIGETSGTTDEDVEQLAATGKRQGVRYVVRSGLLGMNCERGGPCDVSLYAELVASDSGEITSLRANGTAVESRQDPGRWDAYDFRSSAFGNTSLGQAVNSAIDQLAQQLHQAVTGTEQAQAESSSPDEVSQPAADQGGNDYESDQELQQIIAQADALVAGGAAGSQEIGSLKQALEGLRSALNNKVSLTTEGQDTGAVDQEIARYKTDLQAIIAASAQEAVDQPGQAEPQQMSGDVRSGIAQVNELLGEAMNCLLKIQEIRTALQGYDQGQPPPPEETGMDSVPVDEPTSDISGTVLDGSGDPVEGATVTEPESGASAVTDSSGSYVIPNIPSGRFAIFKVVKAGRELSTGKIQLQPGRAAYADWQVGTGTGGTASSGIKILPATVFIAAKKGVTAGKSGVIKGVVRDNLGRPVTRAQVMIKGLGMARTDSRGAYMFVNVPQGDYQVMIMKGGDVVKSERVKVAAKKTAAISTVYRSKAMTAPLLGRRAMLAGGGGSTLKGRVTSVNREPLPGAKVTAVGKGVAMSLFTDAGGNFQFKDLKPGNYRILASKAGYREAGSTVVLKEKRGELRNFMLEVSSAEIRKALSVRPLPIRRATRGAVGAASVRPAQTVSGSLCGVVRDAGSGKPVEGATVMIYGQKTTRTDRLGNYRIDVPPGKYRVVASHGDFRTLARTVTIRAGATSREHFSLKLKEPLRSGIIKTTPLRPAVSTGYGRVRGRITDGKTGRPIPRATVKLLDHSAQTNIFGVYRLDNVPAGSHTLTVEKDAYQDGGRRITVRAGAVTSADFRLLSNSR